MHIGRILRSRYDLRMMICKYGENKPMQASDYRDSHTSPEKGITYDKSFHDQGYRRYIWSWEKKVLKEIIDDYFPHNRQIKYLDFACGTGRIVGYLENFVSESYGVDVSESMLEVAMQNLTKTTLIKADLTRNNSLSGECFNLITSFRFFLNAQPELRESVIKILSGLLNRNGYLVFNIHMNRGSIFDRMLKLYGRAKGYSEESYNSLGIQEVKGMIQNAGLQIEGIYHFGIIPILKEDSKIPACFLDIFEEPASKRPSMVALSRYVIYICKHKAS